MALTLRQTPAPPKPVAPPPRRSSAPHGRKPFLDNTPLLLAGILALLMALGGLLALGSRSSTLAPDFLADVVLYALSATNLTILVALAFVLARNVVKLVVERRRALPFARFRFKLVTVLLGMTLIPAVLVMIIGSELIRNNVDRVQCRSGWRALIGKRDRRRLLRPAAAARRDSGATLCARAERRGLRDCQSVGCPRSRRA